MLLFLSFTLFCVYSNGQAESGRASVTDVINNDSYVASSYLDLDTIIDDYKYPYTIDEEKTIDFIITPSFHESLLIGGNIDIQVAFKTNEEDFFQKSDINYVLFFNDNDLLSNDEYIQSIQASLSKIISEKTQRTQIYLFSMKDLKLNPINSIDTISRNIEILRDEAIANDAESNRDSRKDLEKLLSNLPESSLPYKILWAFDKPIAEKAMDFDDLFGIIAGLKDSDTEISFTGHNENFRVNTVNRVLDEFGGNSYYFSSPRDLADVISDDFQYYSYQTISDLDIKIYNLSNFTPDIISHRFYKSMGCNENHTILSNLQLPPQKNIELDSENISKMPKAYVMISYYDHKENVKKFLSEEIFINYTNDYSKMMRSQESYVLRNRTILTTFELINNIPDMLRYNNYSGTLLEITSQIENLEDINIVFDDSMIREDIELLKKYRTIIYENRDDIFKSIKLFSDLRKKDY